MNPDVSPRYGWRFVLGAIATLIGAASLYALETWAPDTNLGICFCIFMSTPVCVSFLVPNRGPNVIANHGIVALLAAFISQFLVYSGKGNLGLSLIFALLGMIAGLIVGSIRTIVQNPNQMSGLDVVTDHEKS